MRVELFWPGDREHEDEIGVRQLACAEGLGEYVVKTVYIPLTHAEAIGAALLVAGRRAIQERRNREHQAAERPVRRRLQLVSARA